MKNNAIFRIVLFSILALVLVGLLAGGLLLHGFSTLDFHMLDFEILDDNSFKGTVAQSGSISAAGINELEIQWVAGSVTVVPGDTDEIVFEESGSYQYPMVYGVHGSKLTIQFYEGFKFGLHSTSLPSKDLTVTVPSKWAAGNISVKTVSADVNISDLILGELEVEGASADCKLYNIEAYSLDMSTVSGNLDFIGSADDISIEGVSADMTAAFTQCPRQIEVDGVSGDLNLTLPESCGFRVDMDTVSGQFNCDLPVTQKNHVYTYGDGSCRIDMDCISGDLNLRTQVG